MSVDRSSSGTRRTPPSRASPSARRAPGFAEHRPRRPRRASTAGPPNDPRGPFGPRGPTAPRHASRSARGLCLCAAGRPVAVDRGSGRVVCPAFSFPDRRVDGQAFARSPCGSRDWAESRVSVSRDDASISRDERLDASISRKWAERVEIPPRVIEIYHLWS